jgi:hypothetical protein
LSPSSLPNNDNSPKLTWTASTWTGNQSPAYGVIFGRYEVQISFNPRFTDTYYWDKVPPYKEEEINPDEDYPLGKDVIPYPPPVAGDDVTDHPTFYPISKTVPPDWNAHRTCLHYPAIEVAHNPRDETINGIDQPYYQLHGEFDGYDNIKGDAHIPDPNFAEPVEYGPLCGARTYYWRVRAYNSNGEYSLWSSSKKLPIMIDPTRNQVAITDATINPRAHPLHPVFSWASVYGARLYNFEMLDASTQKVLMKTQVTSPQIPSILLKSGQQILWRVSVYGGGDGYYYTSPWTPFPYGIYRTP